LILFSPLLLVFAIAIKLDSSGPVFYLSERIGKKGRAFPLHSSSAPWCTGADKQRDSMMHMNEREGVLFKIHRDPRITKVGRFLRKYSLDEFPQFFNVLRGDMSVVGPAAAHRQRSARVQVEPPAPARRDPRNHRPVRCRPARIPLSIAISRWIDLYRKLERLAGYSDYSAHHRRGCDRNRQLAARY